MKQVRFIEKSHQYVDDETGDDLISVSKFTEKFKPKIDWATKAQGVATRLTKETGVKITKKEILAKWAYKRDKSAEIGTLYHNIREDELIASHEPVFYNKKCKKKTPEYKGKDKLSLPINLLEYYDKAYLSQQIYHAYKPARLKSLF